MTKYRVMRKHEPEDTIPVFEVLGTFDAHTAKSAIQQAVLGMSDAQRKDADGSTFAATPDGSWTELTVGVAVETKVTVA